MSAGTNSPQTAETLMTAEPASASPRKRELERGRSRDERDSLRQTTTRLGASKKCVHTTPHCWWKQKPGRADRKCEEHASTATKNWADAASGTETFSFSAVIFFALGVVGGMRARELTARHEEYYRHRA